MGFSIKKAIRSARNVVKKVAAPVTGITEKVFKPIAKPLRPIVSKAIPFVAPIALVTKAKAFGIKSERGVAGYKRSQKVARIGTAAVAVAAGAYVAAPVLLPALGSAAPLLGKGALAVAPSVLPLLGGGGGGPTEETAWNPETGYEGGGGGGGFAPDPSDYAPSPSWPARPYADAATVSAPSGPSPVLALAGIGLGLYLLTKGG